MSHRRRGFTIVELMLAMSVLAVLLIAIATLVIQIGHVYTKGITLKGLNQAATTIMRDVETTVAQADTSLFVSVPSLPLTQGSGRFCTGLASYAWNTPRDSSSGISTRNLYAGNDVGTEIRFVRIDDREGLVCKKVSDIYPPIEKAKSREMLPEGQYDFAVHELYVGTSPTDPSLHWIVMKLGSSNQTDVDIALQQCRIDGGMGDYCAIRVFESTVQSTSKE